MNARRIFVYGASGHGKVVADILLCRRDPGFAGFVDDSSKMHGRSLIGLPVFGDGNWLEQESKKGPVGVALGVGDNAIRKRLAMKCLEWGIELLTLVHPAASVSASAVLCPGVVVMAQAAINPQARIGRGAVINTGAVVEHDVEVGEFAHVAPRAALGGAARLGELSMLALGATVLHCVNVGANTTVGAGSVVTRDIPKDVVAYGTPARIIRDRFSQ